MRLNGGSLRAGVYSGSTEPKPQGSGPIFGTGQDIWVITLCPEPRRPQLQPRPPHQDPPNVRCGSHGTSSWHLFLLPLQLTRFTQLVLTHPSIGRASPRRKPIYVSLRSCLLRVRHKWPWSPLSVPCGGPGAVSNHSTTGQARVPHPQT